MVVVFDSSFAFLGFFLAEGDGGSGALRDSGPAVIEAVQFWRLGLAGTVRFAAGALRGGDAAGQQRALAGDDNFLGFSG